MGLLEYSVNYLIRYVINSTNSLIFDRETPHIYTVAGASINTISALAAAVNGLLR